MLQFGSMTKLQPIGSQTKFQDNNVELRGLTSVKSSRGAERHKMSVETKHQNRAFITQEEPYNEFFEEATMHTTKMQGFENEEKGYKSLSDKKVKNILSRLDSTMNKLNNAWKSCEKSFNRTSSSFFNKGQKASATFALTEPTFDGSTHVANSVKSAGVQHFLSMTMSDFFDPNVTTKINKVIQSLDLDPHSNKIRDNLWERVNEGRDYYNILKDEIRKKKEQLKQLKERDEVCDIIANNSALENRVIELQEEIVKAKSNIETAEMQTEVLKSMITKRKEDRDLFRKRFILDYHPLLKYQQGVEKYIDDIVDLNKELQNYMNEMVGVTKSSKENQKLFKRIKKVQKEHRDKEAKFEQNVDVEKIFQRKRKQFIIKTKKEIEQEKQREKEMEEQEKREKLNYLFEMKQEYENNFDLLSMVSKQYHDKEEYVNHLDNLRQNNEDLENKVKILCEEIALKRKIDLPTLQAELDELKATKDPTMGFFESSRLRRELIQKNKRNEELERSFISKQTLLTNLVRGVMTIFNSVSIVKDYLNLEKLDEIKLKQDNLGDVLLFCGEVVEILNKNQASPVEPKSQPLSFMSISEE